MKKIKVFYMGQRLKDVYPHATKFQVFKWRVREFLKKVLRVATVGAVGYVCFIAGSYLNPTTVVAFEEKIIQKEVEAPVLERIAGCESEGNRKSKGSHFGKDGQVRTNANNNKSVDIGKFQINQSAWGKKATELGYDLFIEADNEAMAKWIYQNRGTEDWYSSKKCWQ